MMASSGNSVSAYFTSACQNWTSYLDTEIADVLFCPISPNTDVTQLCASVLSDPELEKSQSFVSKELSAAYIQRRAFRRYCAVTMLKSSSSLSDQHFKETEKGRPFLPHASEICFSFSSCSKGFIGAWSDTHTLGVDIEDIDQNAEPLDLAEKFFSPAETKLIEQEKSSDDRKRAFFQLWCLKEAALKSIGEGLPFGMDKFQFAFQPKVHVTVSPSEQIAQQEMQSHLVVRNHLIAALVTHKSKYEF